MKVIKGDLLDFPDDSNIILHGCNINKTFGKGLALKIKERYPEAYKADQDFNQKECESKFSWAPVSERKWVGNLYQQSLNTLSPQGCPFNLNWYMTALWNAVDALSADFALEYGAMPKYALPYGIGSALAGGNWDYIRSASEWIFNKYPGIESIWVYLPGSPIPKNDNYLERYFGKNFQKS